MHLVHHEESDTRQNDDNTGKDTSENIENHEGGNTDQVDILNRKAHLQVVSTTRLIQQALTVL